jgi:hypothetical protein
MRMVFELEVDVGTWSGVVDDDGGRKEERKRLGGGRKGFKYLARNSSAGCPFGRARVRFLTAFRHSYCSRRRIAIVFLSFTVGVGIGVDRCSA